MKRLPMTLSLGVSAALLAGCVETSKPASGLSGTDAEFDAMTGPCMAQAGRLTGAGAGSVRTLERIQTGGGPVLTLMAGGAKYTCRLEANGTVTVFSEFAN